jgi:hypothetical protein
MRLQLIALAWLLPGLAHAQPVDEPTATAQVRVYADDDHVTVVSPSASMTALASPRVAISVDAEVDAVTAASVDVVTSASPRTVEERRVELGVAARLRTSGPTWFTLGTRGSHENDYDALRTHLTVRRELAQRNAALELSYVLGNDQATSVTDSAFRRTRLSHELELTASQLLGPRTVVDAIGDVMRADGYHAGSPLAMRMPENTPRVRASLAAALRLRHALTRRWTSAALYRFYVDDWSITSHTATGELYCRIKRSLVGLSLRGYVQDGASFYRAHYDGMPELRTRDRTLGPMRSAHASLTVDTTVGAAEVWHIVGGLGLLRFWFLDFPAQANRDALVVSTSVTTSW